MNPREAIKDTPPVNGHPSQDVGGVPSQDVGGVPLPRRGRLKKAEEKKAELSCPVQDGTGSLGFEANPVPINGSTQTIPASFISVSPDVVKIGAGCAPSTVSGATEQEPSPPLAAAPFRPSPSRGEAGSSGSGNTNTDARIAVIAHHGHNGSTGGTQGGETTTRLSRPVFVVTEAFCPLKLPSGIGPVVSAKRQDAIVQALNKGGFRFKKEGPIFTQFDRFKVAAVDVEGKNILLTADDSTFANRQSVQDLCAEFLPQDWKVVLWTGDDQSLHLVAEQKAHPEPVPQALNREAGGCSAGNQEAA